MTLGTVIKQTRQDKQLSQPQLSEMVGIEQSYLSKLENDKSLPSDEILTSILAALDLTMNHLLEFIESPSERRRIQQIPVVAQHLAMYQKKSLHQHRLYLSVCAIVCALAVAMFYAGYNASIFSETRYQYLSHGPLLEGETPDVYTKSPVRMVKMSDPDYDNKVEELRTSIENRRFRTYLYLDEFIGDLFVRDADDGKRAYHYRDKVVQERAINGWLQAIGVFLFVLSVIGLILKHSFFNRN